MTDGRWAAPSNPLVRVIPGGDPKALHLNRFTVGQQRVPNELMRALAWVKWAAAWTNRDLYRLDPDKAQAIVEAAEQVAGGGFEAAFPLSLWQGDVAMHGVDHMNDVLAHLASQPSRGPWRLPRQVDPRTDVGLGQEPGLAFAAATQVAAALQAKARLLPALTALRGSVRTAADRNATSQPPGFEAALAHCEAGLRQALGAVHALCFGVDGSPGSHHRFDFGERLTRRLAERLALPLLHVAQPQAGYQTMLPLHGALRTLACVLARMEDSQSPTVTTRDHDLQVLAMVCAQVMGHDAAIGYAAGQSQPDQSVFEPLIATNTLDSLRLLADAMTACSLRTDDDRAAAAAHSIIDAWPDPGYAPIPEPARRSASFRVQVQP